MSAVRAVEGFTFGCDPEVFVTDNRGELVSAHGLIPGTKKEPHKVECGAIQVDGMAAEFNTDPASTFEEFNRNIVIVMRQLRAALPKGYNILAKSSVVFPKEIIDAQPLEALELGCEPDYNAWTGGERNPRPEPGDSGLRSASGHLHIGWGKDINPDNKDHIGHCCDIVRQLDWFIGAPGLQFEDDPERRKLYGRAGAHRRKNYGVEYRVPSNFWIVNIDRRRWVWNRMQEAISRMRDKRLYEKYTQLNGGLVDAINSTNVEPFLQACKENKTSKFAYPMKTLDAYYRQAV